MSNNIDTLLEDLKSFKSRRTKDSLDKLNNLLENRFNKGEKDYSIATIGRVSSAEGGVGTVSIRNKSGEHFRRLINAWATKANTTMQKPLSSQSRKRSAPSDTEILKRLNDPTLKAFFGFIMAENRMLKQENSILKENTKPIIDTRPNGLIHKEKKDQVVEVLPGLNALLLLSDIEALEDAIDKKKMIQRGWTISKYGAVIDEHGRPLFKNGFVLAIQKVLNQVLGS